MFNPSLISDQLQDQLAKANPFPQPSMSVSLSQNLTVSCTMISLCIVFKDRGALCSVAQRKSYYSKETPVCQALFSCFSIYNILIGISGFNTAYSVFSSVFA